MKSQIISQYTMVTLEQVICLWSGYEALAYEMCKVLVRL